ncbi:MAG: tetratricopeptide repeat protein [Promethearchaeota archaeon]|nr:MAG: tetratricopeptide repeat protein [Candidatus Lokiarchaeota archaeon]
MDPPSSLLSAAQFSRILLEYCVPKEEIETLLKLPGMRYELVVERIQKNFDKNLEFLKYFELITEPNIIHFYLAREINNSHPVITTNFDFLIEFALMQVLPESQHKKIFPVITKQDYLENQDYEVIYKEGKFPLYKIHGSKKNVITGEDTTSSLITTLTSLGKDREGETFAIEPFKKGTIHNLLENGTLIVMGYSGSDAFDIGPLLENFPSLKRLIWIDHSFDNNMIIREILPDHDIDANSTSACEELLLKISNPFDYETYYIKTNTVEFVSKVLWSQLLTEITSPTIDINSQVSQRVDFRTWVKPIFAETKILRKYNILIKLFSELGNFEKAFEYAQKGLEIAEKKEDLKFKAIFLNDIGLFNVEKENYEKALDYIERALEISRKLNSKYSIGLRLNSLGFIYSKKGDLQKALKYFEEAKEIFEEQQELRDLANTLNNIGTVHQELDEIDEALDYSEAALLLHDKIGNLSGKAIMLNNMGNIYSSKLKDFDKGLKYHQEALKINEELGNLTRQATNLNNIGYIYCNLHQYSKANDTYLKALKIVENSNDLETLATIYNNLGDLREEENNLEEALEYYVKSLNLVDMLGNYILKAEYQIVLGSLYVKLNDLNSAILTFKESYESAKKVNFTIYMLRSLSNLADTYFKIEQFDDAIATYTKAINLAEEFNEISSQVTYLNNLGILYMNLEKFELAIETFKSGLDREKRSGIYENELIILANIADTYGKLGNLNNALEYYETALTRAQELDDKEELAALHFDIGLLMKDNSKFSEALESFSKSLHLYRELKDPEGLQESFGALGNCAVSIGDYESAKIFCEKALLIAEKLNWQDIIQIQKKNLEFINRKLN